MVGVSGWSLNLLDGEENFHSTVTFGLLTWFSSDSGREDKNLSTFSKMETMRKFTLDKQKHFLSTK